MCSLMLLVRGCVVDMLPTDTQLTLHPVRTIASTIANDRSAVHMRSRSVDFRTGIPTDNSSACGLIGPPVATQHHVEHA